MPRLPAYRRPIFDTVVARVGEPRGFIQVLAGPRQVGKTTVAQQAAAAVELATHYATADEALVFDRDWITAQWQLGRQLARTSGDGGALLILDEVQKIPGWSDVVKLHWDEDGFAGTQLKVMILGSAPLLVQRGLTESLAGRFEVIRLGHWAFAEMHSAFGVSVDEFVFYGGYPGASRLTDDFDRWRRYILDALIETSISRDVLLLNPVMKPALLRQLFGLACEYSGQVLSYNKMLGQLHDAGNATTLAHYVDLLDGAGMITGLQKYSGSTVRRKASSPKLLVRNTALMSAVLGRTFEEARAEAEVWGRLVETSVGTHLLGQDVSLSYWRERDREVDFVVETGASVTAVEVTSGRRKRSLPGIGAFSTAYPGAISHLVGGQGTPLDEFLAKTWTDPA